jgi:DNA-binding NarL/FixJ family response regulator
VNGCAARTAGWTLAPRLRTAHTVLSDLGIAAFAEQARHELAATGETARRRSVDTVGELTAQEAHIARLAAAGKTNPEIAAQLYVSPRTVEWHMGRIFTKLGVGSRRKLDQALRRPNLMGVPG